MTLSQPRLVIEKTLNLLVLNRKLCDFVSQHGTKCLADLNCPNGEIYLQISSKLAEINPFS
jgi:hypothetical protein